MMQKNGGYAIIKSFACEMGRKFAWENSTKWV